MTGDGGSGDANGPNGPGAEDANLHGASLAQPFPASGLTVVSWNLLRTVGAGVEDVVALCERERPDLLLMQEATSPFEALSTHLGGHYAWAPLPGRIHGLAMWSPRPWHQSPVTSALPPGSIVQRICQIVTIGPVGIANVHLSHGQRLNRQQLRRIAGLLPPRAAVLGDYNLVGPAMLPGFRDAGPRKSTHRMAELVPLRIDRCLVRGLVCSEPRVLPRSRSDHHPIAVRLSIGPTAAEPPVRCKEAATDRPHRGAARAGFWR